MFEKFTFSQKQIDRYYESALRDFKIAKNSDISEVSFRFCYDCLLKLAIAICAENGLRVKARRGHHIELIKKLSFYLNDSEVKIMANEMRSKRNWDLYGGGVLISDKEVKSYIDWIEQIVRKVELYFNNKRPRLKI